MSMQRMSIRRRATVVALSAAMLTPGAVALAGSAFAASPDQVATVRVATKTMYVVKGGTNIRSGPGADYRKIGNLKGGTKVNVIGSAQGWSNEAKKNVSWSQLSTGGWVNSAYLTSKASGTLLTTGTSQGEGWYTTQGVNTRSGPGRDFSKNGWLNKGTRVSHDNCEKGWSAEQGAWVYWCRQSGNRWISEVYLIHRS